jgi:hypothetical protein
MKMIEDGLYRSVPVAKQLSLIGRQYWIYSEPHQNGWRAWVVEARSDGSTDEVGIQATGETRGVADDGAERKLRRLLQAKP